MEIVQGQILSARVKLKGTLTLEQCLSVFIPSAFGLAYATSRIIAGSASGRGGGSQDQGVRIQLPPATYNKVPVVYGHVFSTRHTNRCSHQ